MKPPSVCLAFGTHRVCLSSGSGAGEPAEVDTHPLLALDASTLSQDVIWMNREPLVETARPHGSYP
jgi:hypothetical protein